MFDAAYELETYYDRQTCEKVNYELHHSTKSEVYTLLLYDHGRFSSIK